jgi:hypothetical protein
MPDSTSHARSSSLLLSPILSLRAACWQHSLLDDAAARSARTFTH